MAEEVKALSLWQPWASLIACGVKTIETRGWSTHYRGPLAIHAAKRRMDLEGMPLWWQHRDAIEPTEDAVVPYGAVVATCELVDVRPISETELFRMAVMLDPAGVEGGTWVPVPADQTPYGNFTEGRFAWLLADVEPVEPIPATGRQRLWNWRNA